MMRCGLRYSTGTVAAVFTKSSKPSLIGNTAMNMPLPKAGSEAEIVLNQNAATVSQVILDLSMPVMNGQDVPPKVLAIESSLKVIISSGYAETDAMKCFKSMPVSGFIQKLYCVQPLIKSEDSPSTGKAIEVLLLSIRLSIHGIAWSKMAVYVE